MKKKANVKLLFEIISVIFLICVLYLFFILGKEYILSQNNFYSKKENLFFNINQSESINNTKLYTKITKKHIEEYIAEKEYKVSIGYYNFVTGDSFYYNKEKIYYGASLIKTLDAIYLYDNDMITEKTENYIQKAISKSDNLSHEHLVNFIGRQNLKEYGINLGAINTLSGTDNYGITTVSDQIIYLKKLYSIIQSNQNLKEYFINDYGNYIKINGVTNLHKYGFYDKFYHDVGIFLDENPYILIILTEHGKDNFKEIAKDLSELIYKYHINKIHI